MHRYQTVIDDVALQAFYQKPLVIQHIDRPISGADTRAQFDDMLPQENHADYDAVRFYKTGISDNKIASWRQFEEDFAKVRHEIMLMEIDCGRPYFDAETPNAIMFNTHIDGFYNVDLNNCESVYTRMFAEAQTNPRHDTVTCYKCNSIFALCDLTPFRFSACAKCGAYTPFFTETISKAMDTIHKKLYEKERFARTNLAYMRQHNPYIYLVSEKLGAIPSFMLSPDSLKMKRARRRF